MICGGNEHFNRCIRPRVARFGDGPAPLSPSYDLFSRLRLPLFRRAKQWKMENTKRGKSAFARTRNVSLSLSSGSSEIRLSAPVDSKKERLDLFAAQMMTS